MPLSRLILVLTPGRGRVDHPVLGVLSPIAEQTPASCASASCRLTDPLRKWLWATRPGYGQDGQVTSSLARRRAELAVAEEVLTGGSRHSTRRVPGQETGECDPGSRHGSRSRGPGATAPEVVDHVRRLQPRAPEPSCPIRPARHPGRVQNCSADLLDKADWRRNVVISISSPHHLHCPCTVVGLASHEGCPVVPATCRTGPARGWMPMSGFVMDLSAGGVLCRPVALT